MGAAKKQQVDESSNAMETSASVLGKRARTVKLTIDAGTAGDETTEKRPCNEALGKISNTS